jgi:hypothetical protein
VKPAILKGLRLGEQKLTGEAVRTSGVNKHSSSRLKTSIVQQSNRLFVLWKKRIIQAKAQNPQTVDAGPETLYDRL